MNSAPLISVIVPVYKVEQYLDRCVESIVNQTYKNLEIILVDDGSPDNCPEICDEWAKKDERVKVIHNQNSGVSHARNTGFNASDGEYISFIDSDDWVEPCFLERLYNVTVDNGCDIAECEYILTDGTPLTLEKKKAEVEFYSPSEALAHNLGGSIFCDVIWNRLYKRNVANVPFEVGKFHEDVFWVYQVLSRAKRLARITEPLYYYFRRSDGFTGETYTNKRIDAVTAGEARCRFLTVEYPELAFKAQTSFVGMCMYHSQKLLIYKIDGYKNYFKDLHNRAKNVGNQWKQSKEISAKQKLWLNMYLAFPKLTCKIRNLLKIGI